MKRILSLVAAVLAAGMLTAQETTTSTPSPRLDDGVRLLAHVPKEIDGCLWLNLQELMSHPFVAEQIEKEKGKVQSDLLRIQELFAKHGLDLYQSFQGALMFGSRDSGGALLLQTKMPEARFRQMFTEENPDNNVSLVDGHSVYSFAGKEPDPGQAANPTNSRQRRRVFGQDGKSVAMYLRPNVIISAPDLDALQAYRESIKTSGTFVANSALAGFRRRVAPDSVAWAVFVNPQPEQGQPQQNPLNSVRGGSLSLHFGLKDNEQQKDDLRLVLRLACPDAQKASFAAMQVNGLMVLGVGQAFKDNPNLAMEVSQLLQFRPVQQDLVLDATVTKDLFNRLKTAIEDLKNKQPGGLPAGGTGLPPTGGNGRGNDDVGLAPLPTPIPPPPAP